MKPANGRKKPGPKAKRPSTSTGSGDESDDISVAGNSVQIGIRGVRELIRAVCEGTREDLLYNECSLIYECRVCRNLFRSVANFLTHKRKFCKRQYQCSNRGFYNDTSPSRSGRQAPIVVDLEPEPPPSQNKNAGLLNILSTIPREQMRMGLSPLKKMRSHQLSAEQEVFRASSTEESLVCRLEGAPQTRSAVFQTVFHRGGVTESMRQEVTELALRGSPQGAVILADGTAIAMGPGQDGTFPCETCGATFSSRRSLERHDSVYHRIRTCYPCPLCKQFLASPWDVFRHMSKKHHKTEEQIRRLRAAVLSKSVKRKLYQPVRPMPDAAAAALVSATMRTEEEKWIAQFEGELRCSACGKQFTRRAALNVHTCKIRATKTVVGSAASAQLDLPGPLNKPVIKTTVAEVAPSAPPGPLKCEKCGKEFARRAVLTSHTQRCSGRIEPFRVHACRFCGRTFPRRRPLTLHLPRCPRAPPRSPLRQIVTPPKLSAPPAAPSPLRHINTPARLAPPATGAPLRHTMTPPASGAALLHSITPTKLPAPPAPKVLLLRTMMPTKLPEPPATRLSLCHTMTPPKPLPTDASPSAIQVRWDYKLSSYSIPPCTVPMGPVRPSKDKLEAVVRRLPLANIKPVEEKIPILTPVNGTRLNLAPRIYLSSSLTRHESPESHLKDVLPPGLERPMNCISESPVKPGVSNSCHAVVKNDLERSSSVSCPTRSSLSPQLESRCSYNPAYQPIDAHIIERASTFVNIDLEAESSSVEVNHCSMEVSEGTEPNGSPPSRTKQLDSVQDDETHRSSVNSSILEPGKEVVLTLSESPVSRPTAYDISTSCPSPIAGELDKNSSSGPEEYRPSSVSIFLEPATPVSIDGPVPAPGDTLSDIELHRDSAPSSPLLFTEETRQETDSDLLSLASRETEKSEDSCSPRGGTPPTSRLADDSGVSDDGCLPELAEDAKRSLFRGFDFPGPEDRLASSMLHSIVDELEKHLEILEPNRSRNTYRSARCIEPVELAHPAQSEL